MASRDPEADELDEGSCAVQSLSATDPETRLYTRLPSHKHMRLLSLASETVPEQEILCCSFIEQDIRKVIPWAGFNALSYVWGDSPERVAIICNGYRMFVTRNLYNALTQIWKVTPKQFLWADAVCINQDNDEEKGQQVGMMGDIYKAATTVLVWLGDDEGSITRLWSAIEMTPKEPGNLKDRSALDDLFAHPWFTRAWTLQEVLLARKAVLLCGTRWIDWRLLTETIGPRGPLEALRTCTEIMQSDNRRERRRNLFKELLIVSSTRHATDPRDKMYALLGLLTQSSVRIRPDYTISYWQLITSFVKDQVQWHSDLWFLHACGTNLKISGEWNGLGLWRSHGEQPSWLPDLLNPLSLKLVSERQIFPTFSGADLQHGYIHQLDGGLLRVQGILVGIFTMGSGQEGDTCSIGPLPTCLVEAMSKGLRAGNVQLSFKGHVRSLISPSHRYLDHISVRLDGFGPPSGNVVASDFREHMEHHLRRGCPCLAKERLSSLWPTGWNRANGSLPLSPKSVHYKIASGDLLCVLANEDGCFALRQHPSRPGVFRLVGSAFASTLGRADPETSVSFQWPIPSTALIFDLC